MTAINVMMVPVASCGAEMTTLYGAAVSLPMSDDDDTSSMKNSTYTMLGPLTYVTVTVLGLTLSMTKGAENVGEMAMDTTGPAQPQYTTRRSDRVGSFGHHTTAAWQRRISETPTMNHTHQSCLSE